MKSLPSAFSADTNRRCGTESSLKRSFTSCSEAIFYSGFPKETPELKFGLRFFFFFVQAQFAITSLIRMRDDLTLMCAWHGVMADEERFMRWKISTNTVKNTLKTDTKYSHSVRGRPTLKVEERCRNGLVRKPYERSL